MSKFLKFTQTVKNICEGIAKVGGAAVNVGNVVVNGLYAAADLTRAIKTHGVGEYKNYSWIVPHDGEVSTEDMIDYYINLYWPTASDDERTEYYNAISSAVDSASIFLQHCESNDLQLRVIQLSAESTVNAYVDKDHPDLSFIYANTMDLYYEKAKDLFKQSTNIKFVGSVLNIRNTSNDNGNALNVSLAMKTSNPIDLTDPESYDGSGSNISVYNKEGYTKFLPASKNSYKTESMSRIISDYTQDPRWETKKAQVYEKLAQTMKVKPEDIMKSGSKLRCLGSSDELSYDGILDFKSFKDRCCGFNAEKGNQYPGTTATMYDTYVKLSTIAQETPFSFVVYGIFLMDKTVNENINADLNPAENVVEPSDKRENDDESSDEEDNIKQQQEDLERKYIISPISKSETEQIIEDVLDDVKCAEERRLRIQLKAYRRMNIPVVVKNSKFVREYTAGSKLNKGEKVLLKKGTILVPE